jgi:hypothetical protein
VSGFLKKKLRRICHFDPDRRGKSLQRGNHAHKAKPGTLLGVRAKPYCGEGA